jgi:hypothetical protein
MTAGLSNTTNHKTPILKARDSGRFGATFSVVDDKLQQSAGNEIGLYGGGTTRRRARPPMGRRRARAEVRVSLFGDQDSSQNRNHI